MRRLVQKELREHGWVLGVLAVLCALGLAVMLSRSDDEGARFSALKDFLLTYGVVAALVAGNRLVVREYTGKTQLFLEVLPVSRLRVALTKWLLGLSWVWLVGLAAWGATWWWQTRTLPMAFEAARYALAPTLLWLGLLWAVCFLAGLLGRYRLVFWVIVGLCLYALGEVGQVQVMETPPFHLVSEVLAVANGWPAARDVVVSLTLTALCLVVGLALTTAGEGSIAATLSGRMTSRERLLAFSTLFLGFFVFAALTRNRSRPPFALEAVTPTQSAVGPIGVLPGEGVSEAQAAELVQAIAGDVVSFVQALQLPALSGVYVVTQRGLDPDVFLRVPLGDKDGIVLRANAADPRFDPHVLRYRILHAVITDATANRALEEDRHWLLDGLATAWTVRGDDAARARLRLRAAASPVGLTKDSVANWNETFERAGDCFGMAIAFTLVDALTDELGEAQVVEVARRAFPKPHRDLRDALFEERLPALLAEQRVDFAALIARAEAARRNAGGPHGYDATAELVPQGGGQVRVTFSLSRGGMPVTRWRGLTASTGPWQVGIGDTEAARVDARGGEATAAGLFTSGERLFLAVEVDDEALGCSARVLQDWRVVP